MSHSSHEPRGSKGLTPALQMLQGTSEVGSHGSEGQAKPLSETSVTHWMVEGIIIHIEVRGVHRSTKLRDVGGRAGCKLLPIHTFKERVVPEVIQSTTTKPFLLAAQQLSDEVLGTGGHIGHV